MYFRYEPSILNDNPHLCGGVIWATGLQNGPAPGALAQRYAAQQRATRERIGATPLSELPPLAAWRQAFRRFGANPTKQRSAAEALLRRLTKKGDIPSINTLVDIGNLVSIRHALPVAIFDARDIVGGVTVQAVREPDRLRFRELGSDEAVAPEAGEIVFADEAGMVIARRWCWRQSAQSAARPDTTTALVVVEAQHVDGRAAVEQAVEELVALLTEYAAGECVPQILDGTHSEFRVHGYYTVR